MPDNRAQIFSDMDALLRAVRVNITHKLLPSLASNSKRSSPQQGQPCHLQVGISAKQNICWLLAAGCA